MFWRFVVLVISRFDFVGWIYILVASGPGLCILFTFCWDEKVKNDEQGSDKNQTWCSAPGALKLKTSSPKANHLGE